MRVFLGGTRFSRLTSATGGSKCMVAMAGLLAVIGSLPAHGQTLNPFRGYKGPSLSRADLDEGRKAAGRLLGDAPKPVGTTEAWSGPQSGNTGVLKVERAYDRHEQPCREIRSSVTYKDGTKRSFVLNTCRVSGRWRLM